MDKEKRLDAREKHCAKNKKKNDTYETITIIKITKNSNDNKKKKPNSTTNSNTKEHQIANNTNKKTTSNTKQILSTQRKNQIHQA